MSTSQDGQLDQSVSSVERGQASTSQNTARFDTATSTIYPPDSSLRQRNVDVDIPTADTRTGTMKSGTTVVQTPATHSHHRLFAGRFHSRRDSGVPPKRTFKQKMKALMVPKKPIGDNPSSGACLKAIVFSSWLNVLLVFIPVSWALHFATKNDTVIFVTAFFAIIPLAKLLAFATEELALRVGETLGGLLNATLGNAVELIVAIIALTQCKLSVVQASLVGSILSNLLLVLGMCFFAGGIKYSSQGFMVGAAQLNSSLLTLSVIGILIPATFHAALETNSTSNQGAISTADQGQRILKMSHGVAIVLLFIYACNLVYQLFTHAHLYDGHGEFAGEVKLSQKYPQKFREKFSRFSHHHHSKSAPPSEEHSDENQVAPPPGAAEPNVGLAPPTQQAAQESLDVLPKNEGDEEQPQLSVWASVILLVVVTVVVAVTAEFLVSSIDGLVENSPLSQQWVGLILLPIVGNAAEHVTAVTVSVKDKLDLSIGVAVGSSIQIALLVVPFIVTLGWIIGKPLTLLFDPFEAVVLFLTVITVNYVVADGQSNWLEGMILMCLYVVIGVALWFYPGSDPASTLLTCT